MERKDKIAAALLSLMAGAFSGSLVAFLATRSNARKQIDTNQRIDEIRRDMSGAYDDTGVLFDRVERLESRANALEAEVLAAGLTLPMSGERRAGLSRQR